MEEQNNKEQENISEQESKLTELEECKKLCDEYLAGWQRCKADFLNYKKEETQRIGELIDFAKSQWVLDILPIIDNWERAFEQMSDDLKESGWAKGAKQIESQLKDFLKAQRVEEIKTEGEKFNPEFHEAIEEAESERESGAIIEVLEKGYTINGRLLRPAKVKVSK
ncbi:MAG: nucleotide exchange factor GrpE [Candidatus Pacebacteria bacterium]|nr:nucleotide exchange factor GrpE [Candidatus Paceibacterota bacterium]